MIDNNFDNTTKEVADMETYRIGQIIREERVRKKISQEELSFGICSVATLSRIENGVQKPSLKVEEALLERLGHSTENLIIYADSSEIRKHQLEIEIKAGIMHSEDINNLLAEYKNLISTRGTELILELQFVKMSEAIEALYTGKWDCEKALAKLEEALLLTVPNYSKENLECIRLLTGAELQILNNIAIIYAQECKLPEAIRTFEFLVSFLERGTLNVEAPGKYYPMLLYNLMKLLIKTNRFAEAKVYGRKGLDYCTKYGRMTCFGELLYYSGIACAGLNEKEAASMYYRQAGSLFEAMGQLELADSIYSELLSLDNPIAERKVKVTI